MGEKESKMLVKRLVRKSNVGVDEHFCRKVFLEKCQRRK